VDDGRNFNICEGHKVYDGETVTLVFIWFNVRLSYQS
jgi:hypothetical protein